MKKLYDLLFEAGEYTGSFEDFKEQYGDTEKSKVLFDGLTEAGDYTQNFETFNTQYEFPPAKKLDPADVDPAVESKNDTGSIWDQDSLVTSNTEDPGSVDGARFIKFKDGAVVYEDDYLKKYAGTKRYPATFDEYAKLFKTTPRKPAPTDVVLDEVIIKGKTSDKVRSNQKTAIDYVKTIDSKNEVTLKGNIGEAYFNLTDEYNGIGKLEPKFKRETRFKTLPDGRKSGYSEYVNDIDTDFKNELGETKYNQWQAILKAAGDTIITKDNIAEFIDLAQIDETTKSQVVSAAKNKAAELFIYNNDLTEREQEDMLMHMPYSPETKSAMRQEIAIRKQDAIDFEAKTGRPLVRETNLAGRIYKPFVFSENAGMFDKIIAKENSGLKTDFEAIQEDATKFNESKDKFSKVRSQYEIKLSEIEDRIKAYSVTDLKRMSPEEVTLRNSLITEYNKILSIANSEAMQSQWKELNSSRAALAERTEALTLRAKQLNDLNIGTSAIGKSYELSDQFAQVMEESFLGTSAMLGGSVFKLIGNIATIGKTEDEAMQNSFYRDMKEAKMAAIDYNAQLQKNREDYLPSKINWEDEEAGWSDYIGTMLVENSPSILTAMGTLGASSAGALGVKAATNLGTSIFFTMEAGGQMSQLELAQRNANEIVTSLENELLNATGEYEKRELQKQIKEQKDILNLSQWQKSLSSVVYGGTAAIAERFPLKFINNFQNYSRAIGANQFKKIVSNSLARTLSKVTGTISGVGIGAGIEVLEEGFTLIGQNMSDVLILKEDKNIFEGLDKDFLANTLVTSMAISGPVASQSIYSAVKSEVMSRREAREESKMRGEIMSLQNEINSDKLTAEERKRARSKKFKLMSELSLQNTETVLKINNMTAQEFEDVTELNREMRALQNEAAQLGSQGDVSEYSKKELANLKAQYNELATQRESILERQHEELGKLFPDTGGTNASYNAALYNFSINIIKNNKGTKSKDFKTTKEATEFIKENHKNDVIKLKDGSEVIGWYESLNEADKKTFDTGEWSGLNIGNNIYTNQQSIYNTIASGDLRAGQIAAMSPLHELGHIQTAKAGIIKDGEFVGDAEAMIAGVKQEISNLFNQKKVSAEDYKFFQDRMDQYTDANTGQVDADELIQLIGDLTNMGILPRSSFNSIFEIKNFVSNLMKRFNGDSEMYFRFDKPENVFGFVNSWTNKAIRGQQLAGIEDNEEEGGGFSKSTPLEAINALVPNTVKTQAEYFSPRVFNPIYNALEDNGVISNYIKSKSPSKEVASKTIESIRERLINFDPEATRKNKGNADPITFGEFIFANTNFSKLDAKKALFKESQEDSNKIDIDSEQAKGIAVVESSAKKAEAPEYRKIIDSNVLFKDVVGNVKAKVLKTVRTLKSRLDANVSKNKTVTPIIAEIKKEMGKQADIDLKKAIGGKANGQMERFLIKNKKAILENMTTTWLTKAIPGAVQKMVNGNWTSDWSGKKIDRESTKTDNAGRTSGAEMIRRKPNVANMPDAEFLGYFLDSKGDPIRGRKESLAKAMAEEISLEIFNRELQDENSDISKAFENNQQLKGVELTEAYVAEVSKQIERGNVKFSLSPDQLRVFNSNSQQILSVLREANVNVTGTTLYNISKKILGDKIDDKALKNYTSEIANHVQRYIAKVEIKSKVDFNNFVFEGLQLEESNSNLYKAFNFTRKQIGSLAGLFNSTNVATQRGLSYAFNAKLVEEQGEAGLIKIMKWLSGHQTSSGKIGGGRNQNYAGNLDYINNNLKNIPGVRIEERVGDDVVDTETGKVSKGKTTILKAWYNGVEIKDLKSKLKTPPQSAGNNTEKSRAKFVQDYQVREDAAREAWAVLNEYLSFVKENGNEIDWIMTMMSLKSNMASVLKAAAPVKYYYKGVHTGPLRYEHMIPTEYMVLKLTEYYWNGKKFDLNALRDRYNVAIIPVKMDDNFNIQRQSQMNPGYDPMVDSEIDRYFDKGTFGYPDMYAIEEIGGDRKGMVHGEAWAKLSKLINAEAFTNIQTQQKAINNATSVKWSKSPKKIRVFDFDDTLARTKSNVLYTMPDGTTGKIDAATFAKDASKMEAEGAVWDFSEFSKVMNGKKGPLFEVAKIIADKRGTENVFVLTARPQDAAGPIQEFLSELGLDIPLKNITGLSDGNPKAKADWMISKVAEGYNDFYFADDHTGNVKAVKDVLDTFDVKGKVQLAKVKFSKSLDPEFNSMIERNKGVGANKEFSRVVAKRRGAGKGKYKAFITSSADDFRGLTSYTFAGKGKQGEADQAFFEDALLTPYFRGVNALESARVAIKSDFKQLGKIFKPEVKKLSELTPDGDFTYDQALRVYMWTKQGTEIPGISKRDQAKLVKLIEEDAGLQAFSEAAVLATKKDGWPDPGEYWDAKTMLSDLNDLTETSNRAEYIAEFIENADIIFSEKNLNKIEAVYGTKHREALEDALYAMKNGTNRSFGSNKITNKWNNWVNNSIGTIMFFNRRSALMQTLSIANFLNWSDNNPLKAGLAFANQPQYWKDFVMIFNSDKLKQRRGGLKSDVQEAEIANAAKGAKNKPQAIISYLLKKGFLPTQIADSFAISMGGASMYRNRVNTYKKQGLDQKAAEEKAFLDFSKLSDETQQSGDPALVSQQQRSVAGRLILSFQNTTMQYTRLMKKSAQDLINGRGDPKTHISKIIYYGAVQNFIFNALSTSLFALIPGFGDEDEEEIDGKELDKKSTRVLHGMFDSVAKGTGIYGAVVVTLKNAYRAYTKEKEKGFMGQPGWQTASEMLNIAPAIGSKFKKVKSAIDVAEKYDKDIIEKHPWDVVIGGRFNPSSTYTVIGNLSSALLNVPLDRALAEARGISEMLDDRNTVFQRVALGLGWRTWDVGAKNEEFDLIKSAAKKKKKKKKSKPVSDGFVKQGKFVN